MHSLYFNSKSGSMKMTVFADFESVAKTFDIFIGADDVVRRRRYSDHFVTTCMCMCVCVCVCVWVYVSTIKRKPLI